jgi:hypothetical protein
MLSGVLGCFDINAIRWTRGGAQEAGYAFFQAIFVALEDVESAEAFLEDRALQWSRAIGIVFHDGWLEHLPEGDAHSFGDSSYVL